MSDLGDMLLCFALGYRAKDIANSAANAFCIGALANETPEMREARHARRAAREAEAAKRLAAPARKPASDIDAMSAWCMVEPTGPIPEWEKRLAEQYDEAEKRIKRRNRRRDFIDKIRSYSPF